MYIINRVISNWHYNKKGKVYVYIDLFYLFYLGILYNNSPNCCYNIEKIGQEITGIKLSS